MFIAINSFFRVRVLFTFDTEFTSAFDGHDGKSADEHMEEVISIVKNAYKDETLKRRTWNSCKHHCREKDIQWILVSNSNFSMLLAIK